MTKVDAGKAAIKQDVSMVLAFLIDKAVIRKTKTETGSEIYEFYTEEESKVAQLIKNQQVDSNTYSDELKNIFFSHFGNPSNKKTFATRSFNVGISTQLSEQQCRCKHRLCNNRRYRLRGAVCF